MALITSTVAVVMVLSGGNRTAVHPDPRRLESRPHTASKKSTTSTAAPTTTTTLAAGARTVTVQAGDTPSAIAQSAGITLQRLLALNPGLQPTALQVGQKLRTGP